MTRTAALEASDFINEKGKASDAFPFFVIILTTVDAEVFAERAKK